MDRNLIQPEIHAKLRGLRRGLRLRLAGEGAAWLVLAAVAAVFATLAIDYLLHLERPLRALLLAGTVCFLLAVLWRRTVLPLRAAMDEHDLAMLVERRYGELGESLVSSLLLGRRESLEDEGVSPAMVAATAARANALAATLDFRRVIERRLLGRLLAISLCAAGLLAGFSLWQGATMQLWFARNVALAAIDWPQKTYLCVEGGPDFHVMRGEDLTIRIAAEADSVAPPAVTVHCRYPSLGATEEKVEAAGQVYAKTFPSVSEPFSFYVTGGDDARDRKTPHQVLVVDPPEIRQANFSVEYPGYMKRSPDPLDGSRMVLTVPAGGWLLIDGLANKDLREAAVQFGDTDAPEPLKVVADTADPSKPGNPRRTIGRIAMPRKNQADSRLLRFVLTDTEGHVYKRGQQFLVRITPDLPPTVEARKFGVGATVTPNAVIPMNVSVKDDYGLAAVNKLVVKGGKTADAGRIAWPPRKNDPAPSVDLEGKGYKPGDGIGIVVEAVDTLPADMGGPNASRSATIELRIVRPEELMTELVRRQKEAGVEFQRAIAMQEEARAKTEQAGAIAAGGLTDDVRRKLGESRITEGTVGAECSKVGDALQVILEELENNRLGSGADRQKLANDVITPIRALAEPIRNLQQALKNTEKVADARELVDQAARLAEQQMELRVKMMEILERMQKLESKQDMENQLKIIVDMSNGLLERLKELKEKEAGGIFNTTQPARP